MRMSEERQRYLYCAISGTIMDMRVELEQHKQPITEAETEPSAWLNQRKGIYARINRGIKRADTCDETAERNQYGADIRTDRSAGGQHRYAHAVYGRESDTQGL